MLSSFKRLIVGKPEIIFRNKKVGYLHLQTPLRHTVKLQEANFQHICEKGQFFEDQ